MSNPFDRDAKRTPITDDKPMMPAKEKKPASCPECGAMPGTHHAENCDRRPDGDAVALMQSGEESVTDKTEYGPSCLIKFWKPWAALHLPEPKAPAEKATDAALCNWCNEPVQELNAIGHEGFVFCSPFCQECFTQANLVKGPFRPIADDAIRFLAPTP